MKGSDRNNDQGHMLLLFGMIVLFALCPPVATVIVLCIVFSDGATPGGVGCLTSFVILVLLALISMAFQ